MMKRATLTVMGTALLAPLVGMPVAHATDNHAADLTHAATTHASAANAGTTNAGTTHATKLCDAKTTGASKRAATTRVTATSVRRVAGGGHSYNYDIGGRQVRFGVPAPGFDALRATASELAANGLPPRPTGAANLAQWTRLISHLGHAVTPEISVGAAQRDNVRAQPVTSAEATRAVGRIHPQAGVSTGTTSIWSGYVSKVSGQPTYYDNVVGTFYQPSIGHTTCSGATHLTWVGLGGYGSSKLLQDGTDQGNHAWFEYLGANGSGVSITDFNPALTVTPGDQVDAVTEYENGSAFWFLEDLSTGAYTTATLPHASSFYDGSSAEFIDERTTFSSGPSPLADYFDTEWTNAQAQPTTSSYKDALATLPDVVQVSMVNPSTGHTMSVPTSEGAGGYTFSNDWKNCS